MSKIRREIKIENRVTKRKAKSSRETGKKKAKKCLPLNYKKNKTNYYYCICACLEIDERSRIP